MSETGGTKRMCPNASCEKHGQPTGLKGGCDCGTALVLYKTDEEQTLEALWDLMPAATKRLVTYALIAQNYDKWTGS